MNTTTKTNYFVLTGAMGSGKSTLLAEIRKAGIPCVAEPAREILAEQRSIGADGVPETNPALFCQLMLSRALDRYLQGADSMEIRVFDRGIPDMLAYAELFSLETNPFYRAAERYRYHPKVFYFAGRAEIYTTDDERKMNFEDASRFGERVRAIYQNLGYQILEVPFQPIAERARFILSEIP